MKKLIFALIVLFMFSLAFSTYVSADWDKDDVAKLVEKIKKGEGFDEADGAPVQQVVTIWTDGPHYIIDVKVQICYAKIRSGNGGGVVIVPCKAIKKAYPLFAPLITWEK